MPTLSPGILRSIVSSRHHAAHARPSPISVGRMPWVSPCRHSPKMHLSAAIRRPILRLHPRQQLRPAERLHFLPQRRRVEAHRELPALPEAQRPRPPRDVGSRRPRPRLGQLQQLPPLRSRRRLDDLRHQLADGPRPACGLPFLSHNPRLSSVLCLPSSSSSSVTGYWLLVTGYG